MVDGKKFCDSLELNNGMKMPQVGFGTFLSSDDEAYNIVKPAIKAGYRHIDTASLYGNEGGIGRAIKECIDEGIVKREDLFIVTKIWVDEKHDCEAAIKRSLEKLQVDYVDLYLSHYVNAPNDENGKIVKGLPFWKTWKDLEEL